MKKDEDENKEDNENELQPLFTYLFPHLDFIYVHGFDGLLLHAIKVKTETGESFSFFRGDYPFFQSIDSVPYHLNREVL